MKHKKKIFIAMSIFASIAIGGILADLIAPGGRTTVFFASFFGSLAGFGARHLFTLKSVDDWLNK